MGKNDFITITNEEMKGYGQYCFEAGRDNRCNGKNLVPFDVWLARTMHASTL